MYKVVEFNNTGDGADGGEISLVRLEWLTPRKRHCLWPPHRIMSRFNKCLVDGSIPDDTWEIYTLKRIFYETDDLTKAREKAKQAEIDSEVCSDYNQRSVRRRKKNRKIYSDSDTDYSDIQLDEAAIAYPPPPVCNFNKSKKQAANRSTLACSTHDDGARKLDTPNDYESGDEKYEKLLSAIGKQSSTDTNCSEESNECNVKNSDVAHSSTLGSLADLTLTPLLKELSPESQALDVIAKHLARIETDIKELQITHNEILHRIRSSSVTNLGLTLPADLILPCDDVKDLKSLETWVATDENKKLMTTYLSFVGGNKIPVIIRRILEKTFTNKLALSCNWTGKNSKIPVKDLLIVKIIRDAVRANKIAEKATDSEIHEVLANWFRFTKDRNGGREARRIRQ